jgi:signal transduction histidine kinase
VLALAALGTVAYRYRVARLVQLERMRTRIATDLHDDIGANLTRICLLSELAKQKRGNGNLLSSIADIARESVSSMNDIVWAISPEHDRLLDLTRRMRQHAEEVFALRDIKMEFNAPRSDSDMHMRAGTRRDVLLIFKEAVNNAARHSECTEVLIDFSSEHHALSLQVSDNGRGFEIAAENDGHGLRSMARRALAMGGKLKVESRPGGGTTVQLKLPLPGANDI